MNEYTHTKTIEVPQERVWQYVTGGRYAYVWEEGYDSVAYVEAMGGVWHWTNTALLKSGFAKTREEAMIAACGHTRGIGQI